VDGLIVRPHAAADVGKIAGAARKCGRLGGTPVVAVGGVAVEGRVVPGERARDAARPAVSFAGAVSDVFDERAVISDPRVRADVGDVVGAMEHRGGVGGAVNEAPVTESA